jgi:hypothetical protein
MAGKLLVAVSARWADGLNFLNLLWWRKLELLKAIRGNIQRTFYGSRRTKAASAEFKVVCRRCVLS